MHWAVLAVLGAYLVGSLSFAVIVTRVMGLADPRSYGSGNPGATNVLRAGSKKAAIITLVLDALKGWLPVMLLKHFGPGLGLGEGTVALVAMAAFLGHLYPVFFGFKGGKGVATAAGVILALQPLLGLAVLLLWAAVVALTRYVSLASVLAGLFAPTIYLLGDGLGWRISGPVMLALVGMGALLIWRHRENLKRLLAGAESKVGSKKG